MENGSSTSEYPVCSYNEWDPLEEVIVGDPRGAMRPAWNTINLASIPPFATDCKRTMVEAAGRPFEPEIVDAAYRALQGFVEILEGEGVHVRHPEPALHEASYSTPAWGLPNGYCSANPRDVFLVVGNEIIEAPMPDRSRYFESWAFRPLLSEYFERGAKWTAAPKPRLLDDLYDLTYEEPGEHEPMRYVLKETEPTFDAADFVRCGRHIFGQLSHVTNKLGVLWLRRHLPDYHIELIETRCRQPMHIDTTLMPLAPGKVLINPEFVDPTRLPQIFRTWDVLVAPAPVAQFSAARGSQVVSDWMSMNVLMLDEERVIVERKQEPLIAALRNWGFKPIACSFEDYYPFAGSFHCATLDIRRRGVLASYF